MPQKTLNQVTAATTIGRLMYGSPAWWGYSSERDLNRLNSFIRRAKRGEFLPDDAPSFREMAAQADGVRTIRRRTIRRGQFGADNSARTIRRWTIRRDNLLRTIRRKI